MYKLYNSYECREAIKAAGGRWHQDGKYWSLTPEQYACIDKAAISSAQVEPPEPTETVPMVPGETFRLVFRGNKIVAETVNGAIAWWEKTSTEIRRGNGYYDRHRAAKGDCFEYEDHFSKAGETDSVLSMVVQQMPKAFHDAEWRLGKGDDWGTFDFLEGLAGGCAWFGCTEKKVIAAVKKAQKSLVFVVR